MKIVAAILAALTLFMTAQQPVLDLGTPIAQNRSEDELCITSQTQCGKDVPDTEVPCKQDPCCDYDLCNPFGACCSYTHADRSLLSVASFFLQRKIVNSADDNSLSSYIGDIWQPPETASDA